MLIFDVIVFVLGLLFGSFTNVLIYRIPLGKSIVSPPSACPSCGNRLTVPDLIPLISYLQLRGRCRHCGAAIPIRYPITELISAILWLVFFLRFGFTIEFFTGVFLMTILTAVFFIDIDHRIIPDELVIAGIIGGILLTISHILHPLPQIYGDSKWWTPVVGFFAASGVLLLTAMIGMVLFKTEDAMGMGDVKLMAPVGLFLGWKLCLLALFLGILSAGAISAFLIMAGIKKRKDTIPFGPFLVIGAMISLLWGTGLIGWYIGD